MTTINEEAVRQRFTTTRPTYFDKDMSEDSQAKRCFVEQGFSRKLQVFMIDYSLKVQSPLSHTIGTR